MTSLRVGSNWGVAVGQWPRKYAAGVLPTMLHASTVCVGAGITRPQVLTIDYYLLDIYVYTVSVA